MLLPAIVPLPGVPLSNAIDMVQHWRHELEKVRQSSAEESLQAYQRWAPMAAEQLGNIFSLTDVEALVSTRRHTTLLGLNAGDSHPLINGLISAELADRLRYFDGLLRSIKELQVRCDALPSSVIEPVVLIPDTNIYIHQDKTFEALDWRRMAGTTDRVRVLVPMVVVRELDKHKRSPGNKTVSETDKTPVRSRARTTARELGRLFEDPDWVVTLNDPNVTIELLLDPVGHLKLDDDDSEFIDRVVALDGVANRKVAIVTEDNLMRFNASVAGLKVIAP